MTKPSPAIAEVIAKLGKELTSIISDLDWHYKKIKQLEHDAINLKQTLAELKELQYGGN